MITAVDTNVLLDLFTADPTFGAASRAALRDATRDGSLIASEIVWAETAARFSSVDEAERQLDRIRVRFVPSGPVAAAAAGMAWRAYRRAGGRRQRLIGDLLVGAHARAHADRLLTRDSRFYGTRFRGLRILDPTRRG